MPTDENAAVGRKDAKPPRWLRETFRASHPGARSEASFTRWAAFVDGINVELHPGGRAVLHHPSQGSAHGGGISVEVRWLAHEIVIQGDGFMPWGGIDTAAYLAALRLELERRGPVSKNAPPPAVGKPPSTDFYRSLLAEYDALVRAGDPAPVQTLAKRRRKSPGTVKSWLSRGRSYVEGGRE
jgi:hypothetical protein